MKTFRHIALALAFLLALSCTKEVQPEHNDETITVQYGVAVDTPTKTLGDGKTATHVWYALYRADESLVSECAAPAKIDVATGKAICPVTMAKDQDYKVVFLAMYYDVDGQTKTPAYEINAEDKTVSMPSTALANSDKFDLFYGVDDVEDFQGTQSTNVTLNRVVAMVNFISNDEDWNAAVAEGNTPTHSSIELSGVPAEFNLLTGIPSETTTDIQFAKAQIPEAKHLGAVFCMPGRGIEATINLYTSDDQNAAPVKTLTVSNITVEANKKTNITGNIIGPSAAENIDYTLSQGYASEGSLNTTASHRVMTNMIHGSFSVEVNPGYVIRAVYTYPTAEVTSNYTCVLAKCTDRTQIDVFNEGRYAVITFAKASDPNASISPSEDIIKSLTKYQIDLPYPPQDCPHINSAVFFGDSIMHGVYSYYETDGDKTLRKNGFDSNSNTHLRIPDYFGLLAGATVTNNAKRGSGWITDTRNLGNALEMVNNTDFNNYDFAAFCLGINDWIQGAELGSLGTPGNTGGSISEGTVVANMMACIEKVKAVNPSCTIVVYSPYISWGQVSNGGDYTSNTLYGDESTNYALGATNKKGYTLQQLIDTIDAVCHHYGIRHVPLSQSTVCTKENVKDIMIDGLHPSREVRAQLALEILKKAGCCNM